MRKSARTQIPPFFDNDPHILVKWHHQNDRNGHPRTFYIELRTKPMGVGLNLAL